MSASSSITFLCYWLWLTCLHFDWARNNSIHSRFGERIKWSVCTTHKVWLADIPDGNEI
jgi:hypothetical protein